MVVNDFTTNLEANFNVKIYEEMLQALYLVTNFS
jgi:hypothetical protein